VNTVVNLRAPLNIRKFLSKLSKYLEYLRTESPGEYSYLSGSIWWLRKLHNEYSVQNIAEVIVTKLMILTSYVARTD
jgi:hypothetical protein